MVAMRWILVLLAGLSGCVSPDQWVPAGALIGVGSVAAIGRTPVDAAVSLVSGKDCSVVRVEQGKSYCREPEPPPDPPPFCTRSLARVDCWRSAEAAPSGTRGVADGPTRLTPAQEANRTKGRLF